MKCHVCGGELKPVTTDLPFKIGENSIVIIKGLPTFQCGNCQEYLIEDPVMEKVEAILQKAGASSELEVVPFAA